MKKRLAIFAVAVIACLWSTRPSGAEEQCRVAAPACEEDTQILAELQSPEIVCWRRSVRGDLYVSGIEEVTCSEEVVDKSLAGVAAAVVIYIGKEVAISVIKELVIREYERRYGHVPGNVVVR